VRVIRVRVKVTVTLRGSEFVLARVGVKVSVFR